MQNHVLEYLDRTALRLPHKTAFAGGGDELSFQDVYNQSRSIGTLLAKDGLYREPVVVFMRKHPKTITAFFGVIASGCFYVPIDEEMPQGRISLIFDNLKPRAVICDEGTLPAAMTLPYAEKLYRYDEIAYGREDTELLAHIREKAIDTDPVYVVFTSGSTGVPKGVAACHRSVLDYVEQLSETLGFGEDTVFANQTPLYFDACLKEIYPTVKFGATTYIVPKELFSFPVRLVEYLNEHKINTICWVVSALTMISAYGTFDQVIPEKLHTIAFGSEVFPIKQFNIWRRALPEASFTNLYGPTEGTGMCCYYHVDREFKPDEAIPAGRAFRNTEILLLTQKEGRFVRAEEGESGEICIRGTSVTLGYYNNWEKTQEAYIQNPLNQAYPEIIYRTGDIGRYNEYGELMFVSRRDYQIKHMGHRIELGEIEANVNDLEGIRACGCIYDTDRGKIALFYTGDITAKALTLLLREKLPRYMLPNYVEQLESMPHTPNGKLDRKALQEWYEHQQQEKRRKRRKRLAD